MRVRYRLLTLPLAYTWAIARNNSDFKENLVVMLEHEGVMGYGEAAPNIRYAETAAGLIPILDDLVGIDADPEWWQNHLASTAYPACLHMALDGAFAMCMAGSPFAMPGYLGLPPLQEGYPIGFTLPIMPAAEVASFFEKHGLKRFPYLKVKVGKQADDAVFSELGQLYNGPVVVDGNEAFTSAEELDRHVAYWQKQVLVAALEQPFSAKDDTFMHAIKGRYPFGLIADERMLRRTEIGPLAELGYTCINIKLQKTGSHTEAIRQRKEAAAAGLEVMIGCMVETSLGIWHGLLHGAGAAYLDLDSLLYLQQEPFGLISEKDGQLYPSQARAPWAASQFGF